jgi:hypothetical protein
MSGVVKLGLPWGRLGLGIGLLAGVLLVGLWQGAERRADKLQTQVIKWQREVGKLTEAGQRRQSETKRTIAKLRRQRQAAERLARIIEQAPLPGNCQTPKEVTEAVE